MTIYYLFIDLFDKYNYWYYIIIIDIYSMSCRSGLALLATYQYIILYRNQFILIH